MKLPDSYYNKISFFGSLIAGFSLSVIFFLFVINSLSTQPSPYLGLIMYLIMPVFLITGLLMIPIGMRIKITRERKNKKADLTWKVIDLNVKRTRNAMIIFVIGTFLLLIISSMGAYKAFHFTESVEFCGTLCHNVMKPEYTAYQTSPHARVACVECHVGEGANWYVKSKLSGLHQVYYAILKKYPKPIPTPIANLRPARETCEKCHWPGKFYSNRLVYEKSYLADENNSEWNITLKLKTGPSLSAKGLSEGIHWHINPDVKIEYRSEDGNRESIPWVRFINLKTGDTILYQDEYNTLDPHIADSLELRTMDCMDCHNRPSHLYNSPQTYVDHAITKGTVSQKIPYIKMIAMDALRPPFPARDTALMEIRSKIEDTYKNDYPEIYDSLQPLITQAIDGIIDEFNHNSFPEMNVYHNTYTNHIGHQESLGCFRCHSGTHSSENGQMIRKDCNLCHTIIAQGPDNELQTCSINDTLEFVHPSQDYPTEWRELNCSECHSELY